MPSRVFAGSSLTLQCVASLFVKIQTKAVPKHYWSNSASEKFHVARQPTTQAP
jgi:hypothetical protein